MRVPEFRGLGFGLHNPGPLNPNLACLHGSSLAGIGRFSPKLTALGFRVAEFRLSGFRCQGLRVLGFRFQAQSLGFGIWGLWRFGWVTINSEHFTGGARDFETGSCTTPKTVRTFVAGLAASIRR